MYRIAILLALVICLWPKGSTAASFSFRAVFTPFVNIPLSPMTPNPVDLGDTTNLPDYGEGLVHGDVVTGAFSYEVEGSAAVPYGSIFPATHLSINLPEFTFQSASPSLFAFSYAADAPSMWLSASFPDGDFLVRFSVFFYGDTYHEFHPPPPMPAHIVLSNEEGAFWLGLVEFSVSEIVSGEEINSRYYSFQILEITETPIPAAMPLFATGLGVLALMAHRRRI